MSENKINKCKYPKCNKEVYKKKSLFCLEHSRSLKDKGKKTRNTAIGLAILAASAVELVRGKKK
ncbi:hypothetical protein J0J32_03105 [Lactococcus garvieae]|uniref:hypothetical protein n=1 Tax=Lactococcus garvieae TaxID=1363 RepID=UPI001A924055|nr:hypothetical protein [Lactococcus garvieae]MCO7128915.1 hypothetical protein [Lactococcus garvieae]QSQ98828.1 hypothetical protein J0J32_03105 [Lactococcus garvieae]